jgi:hypothetical protein
MTDGKVYILEMDKAKAEMLARGADEIGDFATRTLARITELEEALAKVNRAGAAFEHDPCDKCGGQNPTWFAPSRIWNDVVRDGDPSYLCPLCFIALAEERGLKPTAWEIAPEGHQRDASK